MFYPVYLTVRIDVDAKSLEDARSVANKCILDNVRKSVDHLIVNVESLGINEAQMERLYKKS